MALNSFTSEIVDNAVVYEHMRQHVASGRKLIFQLSGEPLAVGTVFRTLGHPWRVVRETTAAEYEAEGITSKAQPGQRYYEVEPPD